MLNQKSRIIKSGGQKRVVAGTLYLVGKNGTFIRLDSKIRYRRP